MSLFKIRSTARDTINVKELIEALKDCRPDAEVFTCLFSKSSLSKVRKIENHGNFIQIVEEA